MTKLLKEPRIIKINEPKKRVIKKREKSDVKFEILYQGKNEDLDKLVELYKKDPYMARILYFSDTTKYSIIRYVLFEYGDGSFQVCCFRLNFGISVTNKMYSSQKRISFISYSGGKFWWGAEKGIRPLTYATLEGFIISKINDRVIKCFTDRFPFIRVLEETKELTGNLSFTKIHKDKLYGANDIYRHLFRSPINVCKVLMGSRLFRGQPYAIKMWYEIRKVLLNQDFITVEFINSPYFNDTCKMARTLNKKVNCKWGLKRLKEEHDNWSKEITLKLLSLTPEYSLKIQKCYEDFAIFSGYKLLRTNNEMLYEGLTQKHCVGTYIDKVDRGDGAIYHVNGYTLQLGYQNKVKDNNVSNVLSIIQFRGYLNEPAPVYLREDVNLMVERFNKLSEINSEKIKVKQQEEPFMW